MTLKIKDIMNLMPSSFPKKTLIQKEVYSVSGKNKIARVAILTLT